ncbi:hypothetical protein FJ938_22335 [Mesorhizobium sp. B2-4-14]|uniref:hypothetical protein n=1 Tax=Mesorhizobium sp. B2-4-14 TaxID=2589935 RepID=UPI001129FD1F|nr:hypothetical protein [Mesorhizobium sp. B2-4-14]TPL00492.1 hypothetical protein FJ938_22335 [Mesorhizobium sp. B2-4-14]
MTIVSDTQQRRFRRDAAAAYIMATYGFPCSKAWLAKLASVGGGPVFRKAGRVPIYSQSDLDAWAQARLSEPFRASGIPASAFTES